jgi:excisionase family DNA binding protein
MVSPRATTPSKLLPLSEAAKYLGVGRTTLRKLIRNKHLEPVRVYRRVFIPAEQLNALIVGVPMPKQGGVFVPVKHLEMLWRKAAAARSNPFDSTGDYVPLARDVFNALMRCLSAYYEHKAQEEAKQ